MSGAGRMMGGGDMQSIQPHLLPQLAAPSPSHSETNVTAGMSHVTITMYIYRLFGYMYVQKFSTRHTTTNDRRFLGFRLPN